MDTPINNGQMKTKNVVIDNNKKKASPLETRYRTIDVDTTLMTKATIMPEPFCFGRKKICIPVSADDFRENPLKYFAKYIGQIESEHNANVKQIQYLNKVFRGEQDILLKVRANKDSRINNKSVTNFCIEWNQFKKGYYVGKPIKYVDLEGTSNDYDDMKYFNIYMRDISKSSLDMIKYEHLFTNGIAYTMSYFKDNKENNPIDTKKESPFEYIILDNEEVCCVYSTDMKKTRLFALYFTDVVEEDESYKIYQIEFGKTMIRVRKSSKENSIYGFEVLEETTLRIEDRITEYTLNEQRMSVIEMALSGLNDVNRIRSNALDQQEEQVNAYIVFKNVDTSKIDTNKMKEERIIGITNANNNKDVDLFKLEINVDFSSINALVEKIVQDMFDIVGVPRATSNTGQGVSGEAQTYGGGWENAQNVAKVDTTYLQQFEKQDLKKFIALCNDYPNNMIPHLYTNGIEIKYTLNKSNNMMVKAQSLKYFIETGFTREQALTYCEITDDPQNDGKLADENAMRNEREQLELEIEKEKKLKEIANNSNDVENQEVQN